MDLIRRSLRRQIRVFLKLCKCFYIVSCMRDCFGVIVSFCIDRIAVQVLLLRGVLVIGAPNTYVPSLKQ